jgi:hypothetical protein
MSAILGLTKNLAVLIAMLPQRNSHKSFLTMITIPEPG